MSSELNREIGARIRALREDSELSVAAFAEKACTTAALMTQYESGSIDIPVSVLHDIAAAFAISITELMTGEKARLSGYSVVRSGKGVGVERRKAYGYQSLAYNFSGRKIDPYLITVEPLPAGEEIHRTSHSGHEFHYCLSGEVRVLIGKYDTILREGDSVYFDSTLAHGLTAVGGKPARLLVTITGKE
ncbi:MAG: cupin domain-containing protein [Oscillospiraceae bacterium]|jgi:transcriptional regulator with XRE-family HTH domain|nr:cupin domain-containing protein [Oscillospiraceae bacterium]